MKNHLINNQKGFSLIEALFAMVILTIGLLAVGLMQIQAMKGNTNAISRTDGVAVAQTVMDTLRSLPIDDTLLSDSGGTLDDGIAVGGNAPVPGDADHTATELYGANPIAGMNGQNYTIFWNVTNDTPVTNSKTLRLFVYWTDQKFGRNRAIVTSIIGGLYL